MKTISNKDSAGYTSAPLVAGNPATSKPEFARLPRAGQAEPYSNLRRSTLNGLILATKENGFCPPVRSIVLRRPGRARGIRLIDLNSLLTFLHGQAEGSK